MADLQAPSSPRLDTPSDRHIRILDAAERCFVRSGFHRTTMNDVAVEAAMSPGNLYRYFPSKDAVVVALAERDRTRIEEDFAASAKSGDLLSVLQGLARKHFVEEPRAKAILCLEIWAEATRGRTFASLSEEFDRDILGRMVQLFEQARDRGTVSPDVDLEALASLILTLADGLYVRRAIDPGLDAEREVRSLMAVIEAAVAGQINLKRA